MVADYAEVSGRRRRPLPPRRADAGRARRRRRLDRRGRRGAAAARRRRDRGDRAGRPDHAASASSRSRAPTTSRTRWPRSRSPCCSASRPTPSGAAAAAFTGVEHRLEPVAVIDGVRFVNDSQGTQPDAVIAALRAFEAPVVLIAGGRDKGIDLSALAPVVAERAVAAVLIGESGPALEALFRDAGLARTERAGASTRRFGAPMRSPVTHSRRRRTGRRPSSSARPRPASTCSSTTRPADGPSSRPSPTLAAARSAREGTDEPRAAAPAPRGHAARGARSPRPRRRANRTPVKSRGAALRRERHQPDYMILVVVVASPRSAS